MSNIDAFEALNKVSVTHKEHAVLLLSTMADMTDCLRIDFRPKGFIILAALSLVFFESPGITDLYYSVLVHVNGDFIARQQSISMRRNNSVLNLLLFL